MSRDSSELHDINLTGEAGESIRARVVKMQVEDQQLVAGLAKQCVQTSAAYSPSKTILEYLEQAQRVAAQWDSAWPSSQMLGLVGDAGNATLGVYPRGSEGEDLASSHACPQADEEGEPGFGAFGRWCNTAPVAEVAKEAANLHWVDAAVARRILARRAEADEGALPNPLPLIASDGEDVAKEVDVPLHTPPRNRAETLITPSGQVFRSDGSKWLTGDWGEVPQKSVDTFDLEAAALLGGADLVSVPLKSFSERLTGYRPTLHGQNLGLSRSTPERSCGFGLEGARLANSVPVDLRAPLLSEPVNGRHLGATLGAGCVENRTPRGGNGRNDSA